MNRNNIITVGPLIVLAAIAGFAIGRSVRQPKVQLPPIPIHAYATDNTENLVIATGQVSDELEGVFFLDTLSGDLQCTVFSMQAGSFNSLFRANVLKDLQLEATKKPDYLMVTGQIRANSRIARNFGYSIVYVAEANSGRFAAYAVPWQKNADSAGRPQTGDLVLLDVENVRTAAIRE